MAQDEFANRSTRFGLSVYNAALLGLMLLNIMMLGSFASFETTGIRFAASYFGLQPTVAGIIVSLNGVVGVCSLLHIGLLGNFLSDTQMIIGGITVFAVGTISFASLQSVEMGAENSIVHYVVAIFVIYGFGYPIGQSAIIGLFSKGEFDFFFDIIFTSHFSLSQCVLYPVVGRRPQGDWQGWLAAAGSFARILFSVTSGYIAHYGDITTVFIILFVVLVITNIFVAMSAHTLAKLSI